MAVAWMLTLLACAGVAVGVFLGSSGRLSDHLSAAGGGLLFGIALFRILPEIAESSGWVAAMALSAAACGGLIAIDRVLLHTGHSPRHGVMGPLLAAAAAHSFLDGWSVRAVAVQPLADIAVPLGLALHKIPEGIALGWIARRSTSKKLEAGAMAAAVEMMTVLGAWIEPRANASGAAAFGFWWSATVLAIIAGGFLFLGIHALLPAHSRRGVVPVFVAAVAITAALALVRRH
jgi:zinc and cadmium transporter